MGDSEGGWAHSPLLKNLGTGDYLSVWKSYGAYGIMGAIIIGILVPMFLSTVFMGRKRLKQIGFPVQVVGEAGYADQNTQVTELVVVPWKGAIIMAALFEQSCKKNAHNRFFGSRKLIGKKVVTTSDGRKFEKVHLGDYEWQTYEEIFDHAHNFAFRLVRLGHNLDSHVAIFSETQAKWFIALQGCFRQSIIVVTVYASLGEDALIHSLNEARKMRYTNRRRKLEEEDKK